MRLLFFITISLLFCSQCFAQHPEASGDIKQLRFFEDSLKQLGNKLINDEIEQDRKNANRDFVTTLVSALKVPGSFHYPFDSVKSVAIVKSPDNKFRIITWAMVYYDGSYSFYGAIQMNTSSLEMFPLYDYSFAMKNAEDTVTDNHKWYGAEYYKIVPVSAAKPYYVLLGWKGNNIKTTKKVIEVLTFQDGKPVFGHPVFDHYGKTKKRIIFEYTRQASMLLRFEANDNLIVFDHLSPPDQKLKNMMDSYGPDLTYDGFRLKNGRWFYVENLDMRNVPSNQDIEYNDPKKPAEIDKTVPKDEN